MRKALLFVAFPLSLALGTDSASATDRRVALVIGNSSYQHTGALANPKNDAADVAAALKKLEFEVLEGPDLGKAAMDRTIRQFARALDGAHVGLFFYAGHGLQVEGQNYLVPVDAKLEHASGLDFEMATFKVAENGDGWTCSLQTSMAKEGGAGKSRTQAAHGGKVTILNMKRVSSACLASKKI